MTWIFYAVSASVFWGLSYAITDQLLRKVSIGTLMVFVSATSGTFGLLYSYASKSFGRDWAVLKTAGPETRLMAAAVCVNLIAWLCILLSVDARNGTMAAMVESTYPLFTALFAWLVFKEAQASPGTLFGALLILAGVVCVYYFGKKI